MTRWRSRAIRSFGNSRFGAVQKRCDGRTARLRGGSGKFHQLPILFVTQRSIPSRALELQSHVRQEPLLPVVELTFRQSPLYSRVDLIEFLLGKRHLLSASRLSSRPCYRRSTANSGQLLPEFCPWAFSQLNQSIADESPPPSDSNSPSSISSI